MIIIQYHKFNKKQTNNVLHYRTIERSNLDGKMHFNLNLCDCLPKYSLAAVAIAIAGTEVWIIKDTGKHAP